jgi:hypothetical protein
MNSILSNFISELVHARKLTTDVSGREDANTNTSSLSPSFKAASRRETQLIKSDKTLGNFKPSMVEANKPVVDSLRSLVSATQATQIYLRDMVRSIHGLKDTEPETKESKLFSGGNASSTSVSAEKLPDTLTQNPGTRSSLGSTKTPPKKDNTVFSLVAIGSAIVNQLKVKDYRDYEFQQQVIKNLSVSNKHLQSAEEYQDEMASKLGSKDKSTDGESGFFSSLLKSFGLNTLSLLKDGLTGIVTHTLQGLKGVAGGLLDLGGAAIGLAPKIAGLAGSLIPGGPLALAVAGLTALVVWEAKHAWDLVQDIKRAKAETEAIVINLSKQASDAKAVSQSKLEKAKEEGDQRGIVVNEMHITQDDVLLDRNRLQMMEESIKTTPEYIYEEDSRSKVPNPRYRELQEQIQQSKTKLLQNVPQAQESYKNLKTNDIRSFFDGFNRNKTLEVSRRPESQKPTARSESSGNEMSQTTVNAPIVNAQQYSTNTSQMITPSAFRPIDPMILKSMYA